MGRLISVTKDGTMVEEYTYNLNGSRDYEMNSLRGITGRSMSYSDEDHLLTAGDTTYQYDLDGFLTTKTEGSDTTHYSYSSRGELQSVTFHDSAFIEYIHACPRNAGGILDSFIHYLKTKKINRQKCDKCVSEVPHLDK